MNYSFHPEADAEFTGAIDYYEAREVGLGYDFALEVNSAIQRIVAYPRSWPVLDEDVRRADSPMGFSMPWKRAAFLSSR
jgi:hypothetical protein